MATALDAMSVSHGNMSNASAAAAAAAARLTRCEPCDEAFRIFTCLWGQMQLLRLCAMLCRNRLTLLEWLSATGPRASTLLLSCIMCVAVPDEATVVASACSSLASAWSMPPDHLDNGGIYELLVDVNLLAGLAWSLLTGRPACEGWAACGPVMRCLMSLVFIFSAFARLNADYHDVRRSSGAAFLLRLADAAFHGVGLKRRAADALGDRAVTLALRLGLLAIEAAGLAAPLLLASGNYTWGLALAWLLTLGLATTAALDFSCLLVASMPLCVPAQSVLALRWLTLARGIISILIVIGIGYCYYYYYYYYHY